MNELNELNKARAALLKSFNAQVFAHINNCTSFNWKENTSTGEVEYGESEDEMNYGFTVYSTSKWEATTDEGKFTMFLGDDGCGNRDAYVFDNSRCVIL